MPIGITTDVLITCLGAVLGVVLGTRLPDSLKKALNNTLGIAAIAMGIVLILKVKNLSAVVLTLVIGSILGELVMLDDRIRKLVTGVVHKLMNGAAADEQFLAQVSAVVILFCCGGTGWYGALNEGLTGDGSILITKSILDFVTACIFGSILGKIVPMLCIPQAIISAAAGWTCSCGQTGNMGKFCANCGKPAPVSANEWTCSCGAKNTGKFCSNCGKPAPASEWTCDCGTVNKGKFCSNCGKPFGG